MTITGEGEIMRLVNTSTDVEIQPGATLHITTGPRAGQAWRFEHITPHAVDGHRVHVTRRHPRMGRIHREFHPALFGAHVVIDITWRRHVGNAAHRVWSKIDEGLIMGALALVPLAFYEHFHGAERILEVFGMAGH